MNTVLSVELEKRKQLQYNRYLHLEERVLTFLVRRLRMGSYSFRMNYEAVSKPSYAFGVYSAAMLAKSLGMDKISVIEFGVAGGNGLLALEESAIEIGKEFNIEIEVFGFDLGVGLMETRDYRDLPYWFVPGSFKMDVEKLQKKLKIAKLIIGDVKTTVKDFLSTFNHGPIGFCSFDLDYYTSTRDAFAIFDGNSNTRLPRVVSYMDDTIGVSDLTVHCDRVGQLLAIKEFNEVRKTQCISPIHKLRNKRPMPANWNEQMYCFHDFEHPLYNKVVNPFSAADATKSASI